jgi:DNA repair protein RadC
MKKPANQYKLISKRAVVETAQVPESLSKIISSKNARDLALALWDMDTIEVSEHFAVAYMNRKNKVVGWSLISTGGSTGTVVDIKNVFTIGLLIGAQSLICFHNHPSGSTEPSRDDISITKKIKDAGAALDMCLLDHLILAPLGDYYSFADSGML